MKTVIEYKTNDERQQVLNDNTQLFLWGESNIKEGNFLIFMDRVRIDNEPIPES